MSKSILLRKQNLQNKITKIINKIKKINKNNNYITNLQQQKLWKKHKEELYLIKKIIMIHQYKMRMEELLL